MSMEFYTYPWGAQGGSPNQNRMYFGRNRVVKKTLFTTPTPLDLFGDFC